MTPPRSGLRGVVNEIASLPALPDLATLLRDRLHRHRRHRPPLRMLHERRG